MKYCQIASAIGACFLVSAAMAAHAADGLPKGTIAYFAKSCPSGWSSYDNANGRFLLPVPSGGGVAAMIGTPLGGVDAAGKHSHTAGTTVNPGNVQRQENSGSRKQRAAPQPVKSEQATSSPPTALLPAVSYLVCKKTDDGDSSPVIAGVATFFDATSCPSNWQSFESARGRYLVGLPSNAFGPSNFGGTALSVGEERKHKHHFAGTLDYNNAGLKQSGGHHNFAAPHEASFSDFSDESAIGAPYIALTFCSKQ
ncbi:hypothetical protein [Azospirillum sp. B2RO_4]|uniref:hypothetical protein n=1 Tax=Azospirillum sp. B2RO_4 TaxID=3027796 RepID=UPI003DA98006